MDEHFPDPTPSDPIEQIKMEILLLRQNVAQMGANDFEIPAINRILERFNNSKFTLEDAESALKEVKDILNFKQDDH